MRNRIDTQGATAIRQPPRRLPFHQRDLVKKLLDDMLEQKIVKPASRPWVSPIVLVTKKGGTPHFCVDYRRINSLTKKDAHPLPHIDDTLDALSGSKLFSAINLASGYGGTHCLRMHLISPRCWDSGLFSDSSMLCDVRFGLNIAYLSGYYNSV